MKGPGRFLLTGAVAGGLFEGGLINDCFGVCAVAKRFELLNGDGFDVNVELNRLFVAAGVDGLATCAEPAGCSPVKGFSRKRPLDDGGLEVV